VATKAARIDIQLVQERDGKHGLPASIVFSEPEIETLEALSPTLAAKAERQKNPEPPQSLAWACHQLSQTTPATSGTAARKFRAVFS
jgi:hypothetical protein